MNANLRVTPAVHVAQRPSFAGVPEPAPSGGPRSPLDLKGISILLVEDDADSLDALTQIVASFGASVLTARDGVEARDHILKTAPDLILCDLLMPRMNGFQLMDWLRGEAHLCRIPVIAVSALGTQADVMRTWSAGFTGHLVKPIDYAKIEAQLRRVFWAHRSH